MALNFGKLDFDVSLNLTAAFPLDSRSYFESLSVAQQAAASAEEAGSTNTIYYYGQTIVVVENDIATLYTIQPNKTLVPLGGNIESSQIDVDSKQFNFENGILSLKNFESAIAGQILTVGVDGNLTWVTPIDTYTKAQIDEKLAAVGHLNRVIVETLEDIDEYLNKDDYNQYIFMVPTGLETDSDKYNEYIILETSDGYRFAEKVGSWEVNLDDYAKKTDLSNYVEKTEGSRLITSDEVSKLEALSLEAEKNIINGISTDFTIDENRQLNLNNLSQSKIIGLEEALDKKVDAQEGYSLLSSSDKKKLDALQLNGNDLQISGTVNTSQIEDLEEWLGTNAGTQKGLSENNLTNELYKQITEALYISGVNTTQLNVDNSGILSVGTISQLQVDGLEKALNQKVDLTKFTNLETRLNSMNSKIDALDNRLTWQSLTDN